MKLSKANQTDLSSVLKLYHSVIGTSFCVWNQEYPSIEEINEDYSFQTLFVLKENDLIIGAVSVNPTFEMDDLNCWTNTEKPCEIARVVIDKSIQNKGVGYKMITSLIEQLKKDGYTSIRLAVEINHLPAIRLYEKCLFKKVGSHFMYEHDYYLYELIL